MPKDLICKQCISFEDQMECEALNHFDDEPRWIVAESVNGTVWADSVDEGCKTPEDTLLAALRNVKFWCEHGDIGDVKVDVSWDEIHQKVVFKARIPTFNLYVYVASEELGSTPSSTVGTRWGLDEVTGRAIILRKGSPGQPLQPLT